MATWRVMVHTIVWMATALFYAEARLILNLDGIWNFKLDPENPVTRALENAGGRTSGKITVPGSWAAQGYGIETATMLHQYQGVATYSLDVEIPSTFVSSKNRIFIVAERVQRSAQVLVDGKFIWEHIGYLSPLECDVTNVLHGDSASLQMVVNSTRDTSLDGLEGEADLVTDGTNLGGWGGLGGHVRLEARAEEGWLVEPHVQHTVNDQMDAATVNVTVRVGSRSSFGTHNKGLALHVNFMDSENVSIAQTRAACTDTVCSTVDAHVASPKLWSPNSPVQYKAVIELFDDAGGLLDRTEVRFGFKKLELIGYHWKLNGIWLFLHGYGDDSIYPASMAPPVNRSFYTQRLMVAKSLGMNFVRHHSHILPSEYFDAACDLGIMISAEFPIAYWFHIQPPCVDEKCVDSYKEQWSSIIKQIRNYPCVFDYTMDNEFVALPFAKPLFSIAKKLDPPRLVNTADGLFDGPAAKYVNPDDFRSVGFHLTIPLDDPGIYNIAGSPPAPVIVHEMGNYATWPLLNWTISQFKDNIKPYWLQPARDHMMSVGLLHENAVWTDASKKLFLFCWKSSVEAVRKSEKISGYEWWLLQDFWQGSNGILDTYWNPKLKTNELESVRQINAPVVILVAVAGDGLPLPENATRLRLAYSSNDTLSTSLHISNYAADRIAESIISWQVFGTDSSGSSTMLCSDKSRMPEIPQGPGTTLAARVECRLPDLGGYLHNPRYPITLSLKAQLHTKIGTLVATNEWRSRVYPIMEDGPAPPGRTVYTQDIFCQNIPISNMICHIPVRGTEVPKGSVFVVNYIDDDLLEFAASGTTLLVLNNGTGNVGQQGKFPTDKAKFKTAWWLGSATDNNLGTVVYNTSYSITTGMAPDGWADEGWYRLIEGGQNFILDAFSTSADVLIRSIDIMGATAPSSSLQDNPYKVMSRQKALLWQTRVVREGSTQSGVMIVSGLNLLVNFSPGGSRGEVAVPEAGWLLHRLLEHAFAGPTPSKTMNVRFTHCPGCIPDRNVNICPTTTTAETFV